MERDLIFAEVEGKGILIDLKKGMSFYLNETGNLIYRLLQEGKSPEEILKMIVEEYDVEMEEARKDMDEFLGILKSKEISWERSDT